MANPDTRQSPLRFKRAAFLLPALVLAIGLIVTVAVYLRAQYWVAEDLAQKLAHESEQLAARMQQQFALQEETLRGLVGLHVASDEVTRADFRAYVDHLDLVRRFPAAVDFRYARHMRRQEIPAWQRQVAASLAAVGEPPFTPVPHPAGTGDEFLLVEYVSPFDPAAIGLDLLQSPERRPAIARLRAGAALALSERLAAEYPEVPHYALLARLPARAGDSFLGTVALIFRPDRLVQDIAAAAAGLDLELYDRPATAPLGREVQPVFDTNVDALDAGTAQALQTRMPLKVGDREWTLVVTALPDWTPAAQNRWFPIAVSGTGVLVTLLLTLAASFLVRRWQRAEQFLATTYDDLLRAQAVAEVGSWHLQTATGSLLWTPETYRIFGLPQEQPMDYARFLACVHPDDRERVDAAWQAALQGAPYQIEHRIVVGDEIRWVEERAELVFDHSGRFIEAHGTVRDITRQREAEEALRQLNAELEARVAERTRRLEELLVQRQEFLATMSHEIRTPLTGLLGMLELMSLAPLPDEERHQLAIARESGKALTRIIDDILDYSKIEAGKLVLSPQPEDLRALIEGVRDAHLATASAKGISLMSFVDPRLPQAVVMDGLRVRQILQNFVSNALKFTAEGYVEIRAEWLGEEDGQVTMK
ncbi:MAG: CHASE domain-containing protein, partial [Rhodocyclaceae bacterium]